MCPKEQQTSDNPIVKDYCFILEIFDKGDVEFDVKNRNSSIAFLHMKSKCANFARVLLDQQDNICTFKKFQKFICFSGKLTFQKMFCSGEQTIYIRLLNLCECGTVVYHRTTDAKVLSVGVRILHRVILSFKVIYFHRYITLDS